MSLTQRVERVEQESARTAGKPARPRAQARTASRETEWAQMKRRVRDGLLEDLGPKLSPPLSTNDLPGPVSPPLGDALRGGEGSPSPPQPGAVGLEVGAGP